MKKWMTKTLLAVAGLGVLAFLGGCYPDNTLTVSQADNVLTGYNDSVNFQSLHTYYMPDTIIVRRSDTTDKTPVKDQGAYLSEIASQMQGMGYQRLTVDDSTWVPDVEIVVSALQNTFIIGGWYPGWGYPGWGYPGWGWGGGWYYPPGYYPPIPWYSQYEVGTLLMEMINPNDYNIIKGDTLARVYWSGALNGLLEGNNIKTRVLNGIVQAFKQSPEIRSSNPFNVK